MDINTILKVVEASKILYDVITADTPEAEKLRKFIRATALGLCKVLPKFSPKLQAMPAEQRFVACGTTAVSIVGLLRGAYQFLTKKRTLQETAKDVSQYVKSALAVVPKELMPLKDIKPAFEVARRVVVPIYHVLMPKQTEEIRPVFHKVLETAKGLCQGVKTGVKALFSTIKNRVTA